MFKKSISMLIALICLNICAKSELDNIIPAEIKNDDFYKIIYKLAKTESISNILEIGSSSGDGSTEAFALGISKNPNKPNLFCMEISKTRFNALKKRYEHLSYVKCYNVSSVPARSFPTKTEVASFYNNTKTNLNMYGCERVLGWLQQDLDYINSSLVPQNGIEIIKKENNIDTFDMVLIDGSEFSGIAELKLVYGAKFILLDDINAFKNYNNYHQLLKDPNYEVLKVNFKLRNGYAIFRKK